MEVDLNGLSQKFLLIGITLPGDYEEGPEVEASLITRYLSTGAIDIFHIRKPFSDENYVRKLLLHIPEDFHPRLTLHSHFHLIDEVKLGGLHLKEDSVPNPSKGLRLSRSRHSLSEFYNEDNENLSYSFLSPVFDSISKRNYRSKFNLQDKSLRELLNKYPVMALGGINSVNLYQIFDAKFAGAALLGYLWSPEMNPSQIIVKLIKAREEILSNEKHII